MVDIVLPEIIMFIIGLLYRFFPPKHMSDLHGYRSKRSRKSLSLWKLGNKTSGLGFMIASLVCVSIGIFLFQLEVPKARLINLALTVCGALLVVRWTEQVLKKNDPSD